MPDLKYALRSLLKSPGFTAAAVLVLALGVGANTAIFSVVEAVLLRPLPFPQSDRLVRLYEASDDAGTRANTLNLSEQTLKQWREHAGVFEQIGAASGGSVTLGARQGEPARTLSAARVTSNFFEVLGLAPVLGRNFTAAEDRPGGPRVALVGHDFWQRELGGRADVLGSTITIDHAPATIIGVLPRNFRHPYRAEVWLPLAASFDPAAPRTQFLYGVGRLKAGISLAQADAALRRACAAVNAAHPDPGNPHRAFMFQLRDGFVVDLRPKLLIIAAAAFSTLLIAGANFAGLLLARAFAREGEIAVRAALGATRWRIGREMVAQALTLAALGTVAGLLLSAWLTPALIALSPEGSDATGSAMREFDYAVRLDWPVFAFAAGALMLAGGGFGLLPAWRAARTDLRAAMNSGGRGATLDRGTRRLLGTLVVAEIAVASVLLVGSAALTGYFMKLTKESWGFATDRRSTFNVTLPEDLFPDNGDRLRAVERAAAELRALPGVRSATATLPHPMNSARDLIGTSPEGVPAPEPRGIWLSYLRAGLPGYFAAIGQSLQRGRDFTEADGADAPRVCVVSDAYAKRFWSGQDAVGKRVKWGRPDGPRPWFTVVGVTVDIKAIADPNDGDVTGTIYFPMAQMLGSTVFLHEVTFVMESEIAPNALETAARAALARVDPRLAAYEFSSLDEFAAQQRVTERFALVLVALFGVLGLILASTGLYGLLALQVTRRMREFGVRSALGATAASLVRLVAWQGGQLLALGLLAGGTAGWAALRLTLSLWPEMPAIGVLPFVVATGVLATAVALACWLPARRAARVDPMIALRAE